MAEDEVRAALLADLGFDLLRVAEVSDALELFLMAAQVGSDSSAEISALSGIAAARAAMGNFDQAREAVAKRDRLVGELPGSWVARGKHHLLGRIALAEGDASQAVTELEMARSTLPQPEFPFGYPAERRSHGGPEDYSTVLRFDLARAYLVAGRPLQAREQFEAILSNGAWRVELPAEYVRSYYHLGEIAEQAGDSPSARKHFERFLDFWADGDFDREQVHHARQVVGAS